MTIDRTQLSCFPNSVATGDDGDETCRQPAGPMCRPGDDSFALNAAPSLAVIAPLGIFLGFWLKGSKTPGRSELETEGRRFFENRYGPDWVDELARTKGEADQRSYNREFIRDHFLQGFVQWAQTSLDQGYDPKRMDLIFDSYRSQVISPLRVGANENRIKRLDGDLAPLRRAAEFQKGDSLLKIERAIAWAEAERYRLERENHPYWALDGRADFHDQNRKAFSEAAYEGVVADVREMTASPVFQAYDRRFRELTLEENALKSAMAPLETLRKALASQGLNTREVDSKIEGYRSRMARVAEEKSGIARRAQFRLSLFPLGRFKNHSELLQALQIDESQVKPYELDKVVVERLTQLGADNPYPGLLRDLQVLEGSWIVPDHNAAVRALIDQRIAEAAAGQKPAETKDVLWGYVGRKSADYSYSNLLSSLDLSDRSPALDFIVKLRASGQHPMLLKELVDLVKDPRFDDYSSQNQMELAHRLVRAYAQEPDADRKSGWSAEIRTGFHQEVLENRTSENRRAERVVEIGKKAEQENKREEERREERSFVP